MFLEFKKYTELLKLLLTDEAEFLGDYTLGTELRVGIWQITSSFNLTTRTTVIESNCIPVSEEIYLAKGGQFLNSDWT